MTYCIIETDQGLMVAELQTGRTSEEVAESFNGTVIDPGPYPDYEDAEDALGVLQAELSDDEGESDVPGARALEAREPE